jgi:pyruvate dehydrogenase E1 component beta subunit
MKVVSFFEAADDALGQAMAEDSRVFLLGEDVQGIHIGLFCRFGARRVRNTPISEAAFLGAAVGAAMAGLRPVVEIQLVDFVAVAVNALINEAAKLGTFSGGRWNAPLVLRASCGGGYGDGGQHMQSLWGWLAHIPGLSVVVPSTPADAGGLMIAAIEHGSPVVFLEHKMLSSPWREFMGSGGRQNVRYDVPSQGECGPVPKTWKAIPIGEAVLRRKGNDLTIVTVGVSTHRALEAALLLERQGISAGVLDLRTVFPLDRPAIQEQIDFTKRLLVVDEDYEGFGLSGEVSAVALEAGLDFKYGRVCTQATIPYARKLEEATLPNISRIVESACQLM